ncbi:MAG: lytic murein transglycosylase [Deltaproteobacteria bacterium]|nr:lytic murein transglycosylase [Deltaproteobacteria bacterium]MBW1719085.1 lytic murein transglycosylase [Deltaproteobacteria bacterium]MBW1932638.1 lytic murein transglycosylase [Deltaproteobacteria bacterium]MBW1937964.1 lytic murein transglycosylase [Deltaproteobacteria bacterium]MBW1964638.1 lytic murein transglycosylase [Deltaproteobacteria bacterium]
MAGLVKSPPALLIIFVLSFLICPISCPASKVINTSVWEPLIEHLIKDGEDEATIRGIFARREVQFNPRVMPRKLSHKESKLDYSRFLRPERLSRASAFLETHKELLIRIEAKYGVPKEIKVAILLVETDLGRYLGPDRAFNILASMAAATDIDRVKPWLPPELLKSTERERVEKKLKDKSQWAYEELRALLIYSEQNKIDPLEIKGSIFGAIGLCQFMPSNALRFGIDHDQNGKIDLFLKPDALASMANYIRHYGWKDNLSRKEQEAVILRYNYSRPYARAVLDVAERLSDSDENK